MTQAATLRTPALLLAAAMATLFVASGFTATAQSGPVAQNCDPPPDGVWYVEGEHVVCVGGEITLNRLKIWEASTVEFHDVDLYLDTANTPEGHSIIAVGGDIQGYVTTSKLVVKDSRLEALDTSLPEAIVLLSVAQLEFVDSSLNGLRQGIVISSALTNSASFMDSTFTNMEFGITDAGSPDVVIQNNFFDEVNSPIYTQGTPLIEGNTIVNCGPGIILKFDSAHPIIRDNTITSCTTGIGQTQSQSPQYDIYHNDVFGNCNPNGVGGNVGVAGKAEDNWWGDNPPSQEELNSHYKCIMEPENPPAFDYTPWLSSPRHPERLPTPSIASLPSAVARGESVSFDASGSQPSTEFGFALESFAWSFGDGTMANGEQVAHAYQDLGSYTVKLHVKDEKGLGHFVEETVQVVNQAPEVDVSLASGFAGEDIIATIDASDADDDALSTDIEWLRNGVTQPFTSETVPGDAVGSADVWEIRVLVEDGFGGQDEALASVQIPNRSPSIETASIQPGEPVATDDLEAIVQASDPDGDNVDVVYEWYRNEELQGDLTAATVPASRVAPMDTWQVTATATDAHGAMDTTTRSVNIPNRDPQLTALLLEPANPVATDNLRAVASAEDPDGDVFLSYAWHRNGALQSDLTGSQVPSNRVQPTDTWRVTVTATDAQGATDSDSREVSVANRQPVITDVSVLPVQPRHGEDLQATVDVDDPDQDPITISYTWYEDGADSGITTATVPGEELQRGRDWHVVVTASDGYDEVTEASDVVTVHNTAPSVESLSLDASAGEDLVAEVVATDVDGDAVSLSFAWTQNDAVRTDLTQETVSGSEVVSGDTWRVTVTPSDGDLEGDAVSVQAVIGNHAPVIASMSMEPTSPTAATGIQASVEAIDGDGDDVTVSYAWQRNGQATSHASSMVPEGVLQRGESWRVRVTATDGKSEASALSEAVVVANTAPSIDSITVEPEAPVVGQEVHFTLKATDVDGDALTVTWSLPDGTALQAPAIDATFLQPGTVTVAYAISDGAANVDGSIDFDVIPAPDSDESDTGDDPLEDTLGSVTDQSNTTNGETQANDSSSSHDAAGLEGQAAEAHANDGREAGKNAPVAPWVAVAAVAVAWMRRRVT